jgi:hypothetical protein
MEDFKALKIFLFSIINLLTYLLSIYLYTSLYTKSKIGYSSNFEEILNSHSKQVRISFGFHTVSFIFFIISLFIIIYRSDLSSESSNENLQNGNIQNENIQNNNLQNGNIQNESITNENCIIIKYNDNAFLILFGLCQLFYLLNLIFISISLGRIKAKKLENIDDEEKIINDFLKRISIELVVVSYIFFFILLFLFIWALLITDKKFNCLPYIKSKFQSLEDYLKNKIEDTHE